MKPEECKLEIPRDVGFWGRIVLGLMATLDLKWLEAALWMRGARTVTYWWRHAD